MDLAIETETVTGLEDRSWLGSAHGTESTQSATLDAALFTPATHYPNGEIRSGTVLAEVTATGLLGPYTPAATNGLETAVGHLFNTVRVRTATARIGAPVLDHGRVRVDRLPANHGLDDAARADLPNIRYAD